MTKRDPLITTGDIAHMLERPARTVRDWTHLDDFPEPIRFTENGNRYWKKSEILRYLESKAANSGESGDF